MTSVLRSLLNTLGVPPRTAQKNGTGYPAPGRRCRIYRRFNILPQDDDGMQKPVGPCFRDGEQGAVLVQEARQNDGCPLFSRKKVTVPFSCMVRAEWVAVRRPAEAGLGQGHRGHCPEERAGRDKRRGALLFQPIERQGVVDEESPDPRPPQPFEVRPAAQRLPYVVRQGADVEPRGGRDPEAQKVACS